MKFNRNIDSISNLEAVVIHDLRDIGVKIPKTRKQSEQQQNSTVSVSIFVSRFVFISFVQSVIMSHSRHRNHNVQSQQKLF